MVLLVRLDTCAFSVVVAFFLFLQLLFVLLLLLLLRLLLGRRPLKNPLLPFLTFQNAKNSKTIDQHLIDLT